MKKQFLREHHNRQDKLWKGSGACPGLVSSQGKVSRVWEESSHVDWSTDPPSVYFRYQYNKLIDKQRYKAEASEQFSKLIHSTCFIVDGYKFMFTFGVERFAQVNGISAAEADRVFPGICKLAQGKRQIVIRRFQRARVVFSTERTPDGHGFIEVARVSFQWTDVLVPERALTSLGLKASMASNATACSPSLSSPRPNATDNCGS